MWEHHVHDDPMTAAGLALKALSSRRSLIATQLRVISVQDLGGDIEERQLQRLTNPERKTTQLRRRSTHKTGIKRRLVISRSTDKP